MSRNLTEEHLNAIAKRARVIDYDLDLAFEKMIIHLLHGNGAKADYYKDYITIRRRHRKDIGETFARMIDFKTLKKCIYG